jgi:putative isomerase
MAVAEKVDVSPWDGWEINNAGEDVALGPLQTPVGAVRIERHAGRLVLRQTDRVLLSSNVPGRLRHLVLRPGYFSLTLPDVLPASSDITLPELAGRSVRLAKAGDRDLAVGADGRIALTAAEGGSQVLVVYD